MIGRERRIVIGGIYFMIENYSYNFLSGVYIIWHVTDT
jgi:hypothetical protein